MAVTTDALLAELQFMQYLREECRYLDVRPIGNGRWAGIMELMFHVALVGGQIHDRVGLDFRYCYHGPEGVKDSKRAAYDRARAALEAWDVAREPEPSGWHRDPYTHRRRILGDPTTEYVED